MCPCVNIIIIIIIRQSGQKLVFIWESDGKLMDFSNEIEITQFVKVLGWMMKLA